jgi:hypothetical protein
VVGLKIERLGAHMAGVKAGWGSEFVMQDGPAKC